ncbi:MAG: hypothetical protein FWG12_01780 [Holophagaceae bacterium]|nr:hypothetical protein [Holophagaceae bacterium]
MRFLICRTDGIGDLVVTLPVQQLILVNDPSAQVFWLVRPEVAPILDNLPGITGVLHRSPDIDLEKQISGIKPDVLLNIGHRDQEVVPAAKRVGVPFRVARPRGLEQFIFATHRIWTKRGGSGRHEALHALEFLKFLGWQADNSLLPTAPSLVLTEAERVQGQRDFSEFPSPRLGVILKGSGSGAFPSPHWWKKMLSELPKAGWNPIILSPSEDCFLPPTEIRGLMRRLATCDAILGPSTGPIHLAAALGRPTLCLMGRRASHGPDRWAPLGNRVETLQYPGNEDDLGNGMDRLQVERVLEALERLR